MIEIKDISGNLLLTTSIGEGSKRKFLLMKEDYITLKFSLEDLVHFKLGDYVECDFGRFEVCDLQKPAFNTDTSGYDYELQLDAYYWKWKNKIFKYTPETAGQEASWNLMAPLDVQAGIVLRNLKALGYTYKGQDFVFSIDSTVENKAQLMGYDNINILDACFEMAKKWDCECWVTENIIHFGKCEFGDPVDFEIGVNVEEMTRSDSQSTYATRIYAFGSTRNIPANYRPVDESMVVNGVVQKRLMLPVDTPYIDAYPGMRTEEAVEQVVVFDDIYPRRVGTMSDITTHEYTDTVKEEGKPDVVTKWNAYRFKDSGITFSKDYILPGEELKITFQSGKLNGMVFAVAFDPENKNEQLWEIVRNNDYGGPLPDDVLIPANGDTYILSGWDSTKITELGLAGAAEQELKTETTKYVEKSRIDPNTYGCTMMSDNAYREDGIHNLYGAGQKVNLINKAYFENGRKSRIIGFEFNLDYPFDSPIYTVGETAAYSRIGELEEKVESLTLKGQTYTGGGGSGVYVIRRNDSTPATDSNVFSALRALAEFINKKKDDIVQGIVTFLKGIKIGKYVTGWTGSGGAITVNPKTGKTKLEVDEVLARDRFETMEFRFNRIDVIDGEQWSTFAFGKIKAVDTESQTVYLDLVDGELMSSHVNDLNRGIFHNISFANAAGNKPDDCGFYTMAGFSTSYFTPTEILPDGSGFRYALRPGTTQHPCAEMKFAAYGNLTDPERRMSRVTNTKHTIYLKDVATWQIDPDVHYGAAYGDLTGITINGVEFNGYSSFQTNGYFKGHIEFLPDQVEDLKGDGGYAVSLTSYDAIVAVDSQGRIDASVYDILNVVDGNEQVVSGDSEVVAVRYKIQTSIQAFKGAEELAWAGTPGEGTYAASFSATGCTCVLGGGILTVTSISEDKATVVIEVNCEGKATFTKHFTLTRVYGGVNPDWTTYVFKQSEKKPATPVGTKLIPEGWEDAPTATGKWWMSKAVVSGITKLPGKWSEPVQVTCEDGSDVDFKYAKNNSENKAPGIVSTDRYPAGWTDAPPQLGAGEYLWMSKAKIKPDNTLLDRWSDPVRISGEKGYSGDWTSYVFKQADSRPATPSGTAPLPAGWEDGPGSTGKWWMSKASVSGITGEARDWSTPVQVTGQDGNGMYYEYAVNSSETSAPGSGWSATVPSVPSGQYLWMRWGQVIPPAVYPASWDGVARVTGEKGEQGQPGIQGIQGEKGEQGLEGPSGSNGRTTYFHIKYSYSADGNPMTEDSSAPYIGTYVDYSPTDSSYYYYYKWKRFQGLQGEKGEQGIPGVNGDDGLTYYTHIKYSNDGGKTFTSSNGETPGDYIGFCVDLNVNDPSSVAAYKWSKTKGEQGVPGRPGQDANLLDWVKEWNGTKTTINGENILSPKAYFGTVSAGKLATGVLLGYDVYESGKAGVYGLKNNEVVFKLDSEGNNFIGGFTIEKNSLTCTSPDASIRFPLSGDSFLHINNPGYPGLIDARNDGGTAIRAQAYGTGSVGLDIMCQAGSDTKAIVSYGSHCFYQRNGEQWDAPGVLWAGIISPTGDISMEWGDGAGTVSTSRFANGKYVILHNLGHTSYIALANPAGSDSNSSHDRMFCSILFLNSTKVQIKVIDQDGSLCNSTFYVALIGRNLVKNSN